VQRRHQTLIEEAPSPVLTPTERDAMGAAAVRAAAAVHYRGAGTVEFLYRDGEFFFLEMNTRLQVEHPLTELVTGVDLVDLQFRVASGEPLGFAQSDVELTGHAIECRITSEDPYGGFLPSTGAITHLEVPSGPGVRWDGGIQRGHEVTLHYDPLLAKLIVSAPDRPGAVARMARALDELLIVGVETSAPYLRSVMDEPDFRAGNLSIAYVEEHPDLLCSVPGEGQLVAAALAAALLEEEHRERHRTPRIASGSNGSSGSGMSAWRAAARLWRDRA
jgi:acetyl-CoA carboxylase biotin carboxylase subunit